MEDFKQMVGRGGRKEMNRLDFHFEKITFHTMEKRLIYVVGGEEGGNGMLGCGACKPTRRWYLGPRWWRWGIKVHRLPIYLDK